MYKIRQLGGFLDRILGPLLKSGLSLMKNVLKPLVTASASATDAAIHKKF